MAPPKVVETADDDQGVNHDDLLAQTGTQFNDPSDPEHDYPKEIQLPEKQDNSKQ
ncbi:hypothetical protein AC578_5493 [Pseudocercospora eumusae]|uniref:Uncharacterized protein n=1 Tax=Pseudocercospora eumusae TaxID=321146 RepID=A0A139GUL2_9PEZI|nr:hypothetical protein AC578_5493 [Pseudocercospora eumusae]